MHIPKSSLLGTIAGLLVLSAPLGDAIATPVATPAPQSVSFVIPEAPGQTYDQLTLMATTQAQALVEQTFATNPTLKGVVATILAERKGQEVPLLVVRVSRSEWQSQPYVQAWAKQSASIPSQILLGFLTTDLKPVPESTPSYSATPTTAPASNPNPTNSDYIQYSDPNDMVR